MKLRISWSYDLFCVLEHVETIICYKFTYIDIKLGSTLQLREDLHFAIYCRFSSQAKLWGLFTRPTFSTTSSFVILCTEAWTQGCVCKASALGGSMWFLRDSPWDGQNVGLPWQGPFEMVGASATIHFCTFLDILCGMIMVAELYHALSQPKIVATSIEKYLLPLFWPRCGRWISQMFKSANIDAAWTKGSLGRCITSCSFLVVPRWFGSVYHHFLPQFHFSVPRGWVNNRALFGPEYLDRGLLRELNRQKRWAVTRGIGIIKILGTLEHLKKETVAFCCILYVFRFHNGFIMFHDISRHISSHILNMRTGLRQNPHDLRVDDFPESPGFYHQAWISGCALSLSLGIYCICVVFIFVCANMCIV